MVVEPQHLVSAAAGGDLFLLLRRRHRGSAEPVQPTTGRGSDVVHDAGGVAVARVLGTAVPAPVDARLLADGKVALPEPVGLEMEHLALSDPLHVYARPELPLLQLGKYEIRQNVI